MIEIAKTLASMGSANRKQRKNYQQLADAAQEEAEKLKQQYEEKTAYLFRSASEKTRLAYENARAQLAAQQAKWAAHGLTAQSASVSQSKADITRLADQEQLQAQDQLQAAAAQNEKDKQTMWEKLWQAVASYRRASNKKSRFGSLGKTLRNLLN